MEDGASLHAMNKTSSLLTPYPRSNFSREVDSYIGGRTMRIQLPVWTLSLGLVLAVAPFSLSLSAQQGTLVGTVTD